MSLAGTLAGRTFDEARGLTARTVDPPVTFTAGTQTITQRAEPLTDITNDLGFHFLGLLMFLESIILQVCCVLPVMVDDDWIRKSRITK
jgi:hypothetical protein